MRHKISPIFFSPVDIVIIILLHTRPIARIYIMHNIMYFNNMGTPHM